MSQAEGQGLLGVLEPSSLVGVCQAQNHRHLSSSLLACSVDSEDPAALERDPVPHGTQLLILDEVPSLGACVWSCSRGFLEVSMLSPSQRAMSVPPSCRAICDSSVIRATPHKRTLLARPVAWPLRVGCGSPRPIATLWVHDCPLSWVRRPGHGSHGAEWRRPLVLSAATKSFHVVQTTLNL